MANGECPVGASNMATIAALAKTVEQACGSMHKVEEKLNSRVDNVESKQDWILYLLIANLAGVVVTLTGKFM